MTQAPPLDDSENWAASSSCIVGRCLSVHLGIRSRVSWTPTLTIPAERASAGVYMSHSMRGEGAAPGIDLHLHLVGAQRLAAHAGAKGLVEAADVEVALLPRRGASGVRSSTRESQDNGIAALQQCQLMIASWAARQRRSQRGKATERVHSGQGMGGVGGADVSRWPAAARTASTGRRQVAVHPYPGTAAGGRARGFSSARAKTSATPPLNSPPLPASKPAYRDLPHH